MVNEVYKNKAGQAELNNLHGLVAKQLANELDDPKSLALAIRFLKDNEITVDIIESSEVQSLTASIKQIASTDKDNTLTVEKMLEMN